MQSDDVPMLQRALRLLGPLEGRIMRAVWSDTLSEPFLVRDIHGLMPELAYTTVMTTLNRLADKGMLNVKRVSGQRAHVYRSADDPEAFLARSSREQVEEVVERFGDLAIAAFADRLESLTPEQQQCLRDRAER